MRTHSGEHIRLRELLPLLILSNLIATCADPTSRLTDQVHVLVKLMINGYHVQYVHCRNMVLAHLKVGLLPLDRSHWNVMMSKLYASCRNSAPTTQRACAAHAARPSPFT